jgi:ribosomal protein S12 methylthiotransferase accessory factor
MPDAMPSGGADHPLVGLAGRFGAVGPVRQLKTDAWMPPKCSIYTAVVGNTTLSGPERRLADGHFGAGRAYGDPARARLLAVSEALERYASNTIDEDTLTTASATDLGDDALDLDRVPRCSARERRRPGCPVGKADKKERIRWLKGVDLHSGADAFVPAVMASLGLGRLPTERFWMPISTGAAAHVTAEAAVVNGICEVIERDALALTWLQRLSLPRLADECVPEQAREIIDWCDRHGVDTHLFDATTDLGIPTIYCLQTTREPSVERAAQIVGAATDFDVPAAVVRAVLEATGMRINEYFTELPRSYQAYQTVSDGAAVMGRRNRRPAFGFLLDDLAERAVSRPVTLDVAAQGQRLAFLLRRLAELRMPAFAVDISARELDEVGHVAVHVVIPDLQPMSLRPLAQYRAHPRIYEAPARMGHPVLPESRLNPYPQPLA